MEYLEGGNLYDRLTNENVKYTDIETAEIAKQILLALRTLQVKKIKSDKDAIFHREINLQNIYFGSMNQPKLSNFSVSESVTLKKVNKSMNSELVFTAPEVIINGEFSSASDMWSLGIVLYTMLAGYRPFSAKNTDELIEQMKEGGTHFIPNKWKKDSKDSYKFIKSLLDPEPSKRLTISEAIHHHWIGVLNYENIGIENDHNCTFQTPSNHKVLNKSSNKSLQNSTMKFTDQKLNSASKVQENNLVTTPSGPTIPTAGQNTPMIANNKCPEHISSGVMNTSVL